MIVGPPGTGKTDVAVQMINLLYHNYPQQRILVVTHSNNALNQIFDKIVQLDVDERHLLRLGHGEEALETTKYAAQLYVCCLFVMLSDPSVCCHRDFSRYGRVNHMLERRMELLGEVTRLAMSLGLRGDEGYTCETAGHFFLYHVLARWEPFYNALCVLFSLPVVVYVLCRLCLYLLISLSCGCVIGTRTIV